MILSFISETRVLIYMKCLSNKLGNLQKINSDPKIEGHMLLDPNKAGK